MALGGMLTVAAVTIAIYGRFTKRLPGVFGARPLWFSIPLGVLAFAALVMAGLDGIQKRIDPGDPLDKDIYALSPEELDELVPQLSQLHPG